MNILKPSRRDILKLAAAAPALVLPVPALAALGPPAGQQASHFRFTLGQAAVTIVSDGYFTMPTSGLGPNADRDQVAAFLEAHYLDATDAYRHTNHLYVEIGEAKLLVDVGSGDRFFDTAGRLMGNLAAAGIDADAITHVVITHAHPDHILGLRDDFDEPILQNAEWFIGETEIDYWLQDDLVNRVAPEEQAFVLAAVNSINAEGQQWTTVRPGQSILPGVSIVATPGHTPGHIALMIESEGQMLIAAGDALTNVYMDFAHPDWGIERDHDIAMAADSRKRLLDMAASDGIALLGYHFPFPGVGQVMRDGGAYRFIPALWRWP
ncbi:MAG: MBL fold metallo-hydrolase [Rhodobacteraceae bacterium]|nr:MBL fold metallo-hydrolase [Paracoccaceae bacterium]